MHASCTDASRRAKGQTRSARTIYLINCLNTKQKKRTAKPFFKNKKVRPNEIVRFLDRSSLLFSPLAVRLVVYGVHGARVKKTFRNVGGRKILNYFVETIFFKEQFRKLKITRMAREPFGG